MTEPNVARARGAGVHRELSDFEDGERPTTSTRDLADTARRLQRWLADRLPVGSEPELSDVVVPEGNGMSSETLLFTATWRDGGERSAHRCVARIEPPNTAHPVFTSYDLGMQYRVIRLVGESTDVPVPQTLWHEDDPAALGVPFFVMAKVDGQVPPDLMPYPFGGSFVTEGSDADRAALQQSAVEAIAGIHTITPATHDLEFLQYDQPGDTALERHLNHWRAYHDWVIGDEPSPLLADGFAWLVANLPDDLGPDVLSWGDSRIGNMIFSDNRVVAVLDWEMAGVAPPEVDIGWLCYLHRFFQDLAEDMGLEGLPGMLRPADVRVAYARASGGYELADLRWPMAYAAIRHGVIMRRITERSILFGEAERPDDIDDLIMHRASIEAMLDGTYWSRVAL